MKIIVVIVVLAVTVLLMAARVAEPGQQLLVTTALTDVRLNTYRFAQSTLQLEKAMQALDARHPETIEAARNALKDSRYHYKAIEYFLEYFFKSTAHIYNAPAKIEVEEPELEYETPVGFQVMESLLNQNISDSTRHQLMEQAEAIRSSAQDIPALFYQFEATDEQVMESIRQELIRIETLNITGYDAPLLQSGITESVSALQAIKTVLATRNDPTINTLLLSGISYLQAHPDFIHFNRLHFILTYITPLQNKLGTHLFSRNFLKVDSFYRPSIPPNPEMVVLGKRLFFEKAISGNGQRNCAGCHQPDLYFTDGLPKSTRLDGHGTIVRNAPGLLYAAYQYSQDWDGRAVTIEEQVRNVMHNKDEMDADSVMVLQKLQQSTTYPSLFSRAFIGQIPITISHLSIAIAAYIRTLAPFNSPFDRYMNGDYQAMNASQKNGFNLFMGKAQCGTCHFAPLFNGLTPPGYQATEYEVLGTPANDDLLHPQMDTDAGRYAMYPSKYYQAAFKTPTLRNIAKTAPYMHNGSFHDLPTVLAFYNQGGGLGIGLPVPMQTLSATKLQLTKKESRDIIAFLEALTDK